MKLSPYLINAVSVEANLNVDTNFSIERGSCCCRERILYNGCTIVLYNKSYRILLKTLKMRKIWIWRIYQIGWCRLEIMIFQIAQIVSFHSSIALKLCRSRYEAIFLSEIIHTPVQLYSLKSIFNSTSVVEARNAQSQLASLNSRHLESQASPFVPPVR